jgi:hypothetical protein
MSKIQDIFRVLIGTLSWEQVQNYDKLTKLYAVEVTKLRGRITQLGLVIAKSEGLKQDASDTLGYEVMRDLKNDVLTEIPMRHWCDKTTGYINNICIVCGVKCE